MQLTVFGASGKVGREVVARALDQGYHVVAFAHSHNPFAEADRLVVVRGDAGDRTVVEAALVGSEAVISALGSWGTASKDILTRGMQAIIPAMEARGISRVISLTGSGAAWSGDRPSIFDKASHAVLGLAAGKILRDGEEHLRLLEASSLDWTCLRSPVMSGRPAGRYRLSLASPSLLDRAPRATVARALLERIERHDFRRQAPFICPPAVSPLWFWPKS